MFDFVRKNTRLSQLFLALITLPFVFVGVDSFVNNSTLESDVAIVGKSRITSQEFQNALREQGERMQQQMREQFDPRMLESAEVKNAVINGVVSQRLLALAGSDGQLRVSDDALAAFIAQVPALQEDGKFSPERYQSLVASRGMSKEGFEARLRQDMVMQQLVQPLGDSAIIGKASSDRWAGIQLEQREITEFSISPEAFIKQVKLEAGAEEKFYEANKTLFETPEQIRVEYVVLDRDMLAQQVNVTDADVENNYKAHPEKYTQPETRRASHILLNIAKGASADDVNRIKDVADKILVELKNNPKAFAELAKKHSQDPGSAQKGGDLDWFGKGMMVKPFEEAVFGLKQDEVSGLVRSDFGFHIIRLTGVRPERITPLAEVKNQIVAELKREGATRKFAEAVEGFNNMVYEQPDTLQPAAAQWKLVVQKTDWLRKGDRMVPPFDNAKLQAAIFAPETITKKQNTESIELAPGRLVSARVVEHKPTEVQEIKAVKSAITQKLTFEKAAEMAIADGESRLAKLQKGEATDAKWSANRMVLRAAPRGLPLDAARLIFGADASKLPAYVGAKSAEGGFTVYKIAGVTASKSDDPRIPMLSQQYARLIAEEEFGAWMAGLKNHYKVDIKQKLLESKDR